jgi:hypothetical protein
MGDMMEKVEAKYVEEQTRKVAAAGAKETPEVLEKKNKFAGFFV